MFLDSFSHLSDSLDKLALNLKNKDNNKYFKLVQKEFPRKEHFNACLQKLIYPYAYMDNFSKFDEPIPKQELFYNDLKDEPVSDEEYKRLMDVCRMFEIDNLGQLHDLYLKIDVLLLASVFEFYRSMGQTEYGLDPSYYISAPHFSFDAMLFTTGVELELIQDREMYNFFEKGKRGGVSSIFKRLATSNCFDDECFNPNTDPSTLFYIGTLFEILKLLNYPFMSKC